MIREYMNKEELLDGLRTEAINTIIYILSEDGYTNKQKLAAIDGVVNFLAGIEMDLAEVGKNGESNPV